jgi:hypothetical protein
MPLNIDLITELTDIEVIARGVGVDARHYLMRTYGRGNWRKLKGKAIVAYENDQVWLIELHLFEAHGIGRREPKEKRKIRRIA